MELFTLIKITLVCKCARDVTASVDTLLNRFWPRRVCEASKKG
jgi:hypothetical protein